MKSCPYCGSSGELYFKTITKNYYRCQSCDLIYKETKEQYDKVLSTYRYDYFTRYSADQIKGGRNSLFEHILDLLTKRTDKSRLLDVGAGCGFFLVSARKRGWEVRGIEPSRQSIEVAHSQNGLDIFCGTLQKYRGDGQFDVITFINVLDHSAEPWREIELADELLKPGGVIYLRFPNGFLHSSLYKLASLFGVAGKARKFLVFHEFPFTPKFIKTLLTDINFSKISILNSPPSEGDPHNLFFAPAFAQYVKKSLFFIAQTGRFLSWGKILLGTSLEVMAVKS